MTITIPVQYSYLTVTEGPWFIDIKGYARFCNSKKLIHRVILEKKFGGPIGRGLAVHHIDGNKLNNHPANLYVCSWDFHNFLHSKNIDYKHFWFFLNNLISEYKRINNQHNGGL